MRDQFDYLADRMGRLKTFNRGMAHNKNAATRDQIMWCCESALRSMIAADTTFGTHPFDIAATAVRLADDILSQSR